MRSLKKVATANAPEKGLVVTATGVQPSGDEMTPHDYSAPIYFSYYFKIKDASEKKNYDFSSCVITYKSYYTQVAASQNPESLINTELSKVVYADITM